jgi:hypothetical protein
MIYRYMDDKNCTRCAVVLSVARKWMRIGVVEAGKIKVKRVPITERKYFRVPDRGKRQIRKENASLRRMARQKGVSKKVREEITEALNK